MYQLYITGNGRVMHHGTYSTRQDAEFAGMQAVKYYNSVTEYFVAGSDN